MNDQRTARRQWQRGVQRASERDLRGRKRDLRQGGPVRSRPRDLLPFVVQHWRPLGLALLCSLLAAASSLAQPLVVRDLLERIGAGEAFGVLVGALVVMLVASTASETLSELITGRTGERIVKGVRDRLCRQLLRLPVSVHQEERSGDLMARVTVDTTLLRNALTAAPLRAVTAVLSLLGAIVLMAVIDVVLLSIAAFITFSSIVALMVVAGRVRVASAATQSAIGMLSARLQRALRAIRTVKACRAEAREEEALAEDTERAARAGSRLVALQAMVSPLTGTAIYASFLMVLGLGGARVVSGQMTTGDLVAFLLYLLFVVLPLQQIAQFVMALQSGLAALDRIGHVLDSETEPETPGAEGERTSGAAVTFDDVWFRYSDLHAWALEGMSFSVRSGEHIALIGPSGAGKSTVLSLLERFAHPVRGGITVDGTPLDAWSLENLRESIGYVEQQTPVLDGTVAENLVYAAPDASEEDVRAVVRLAGLEELVERLPEGLDTFVGESGARLSGGERQRLTIARALLAHPRLLLLDEATSQLDARNEMALRQTIRRISAAGTTVITVAHRLSVVTDADRVIMLSGGKVAASGSHEEMTASSPLYRQLLAVQGLAQSA